MSSYASVRCQEIRIIVQAKPRAAPPLPLLLAALLYAAAGCVHTPAQPSADRFVYQRDYFSLAGHLDESFGDASARAYFAGMRDAAFHRDEEARVRLRGFLEHPSGNQARSVNALQTLAAIGFRSQDYDAAIAANERLLQELGAFLTDEQIEAMRGDLDIAHALAGRERMEVVSFRASSLTGSGDPSGPEVRVRINGRNASAVLGSGLKVSLMSASLARAARLRFVSRSQGAASANNIRVGVAETLSIGGLELVHVAFLVLDDDALPAPCMLGFPVLDAMQRIEVAPDHISFSASPQGAPGRETPNLALDGFDLIVDASVNGTRAPLVLDLNATQTLLSLQLQGRLSGFASSLATQSPLPGSEAGDAEWLVAPEVRLGIGERAMVLRNVPIETAPGLGESFGRLGRDSWSERGLIIDLRAMTLALNP